MEYLCLFFYWEEPTLSIIYQFFGSVFKYHIYLWHNKATLQQKGGRICIYSDSFLAFTIYMVSAEPKGTCEHFFNSNISMGTTAVKSKIQVLSVVCGNIIKFCVKRDKNGAFSFVLRSDISYFSDLIFME